MQPLVSTTLRSGQTDATAAVPLGLTTVATGFDFAALRVRVRRAGFLLA